MRTTLRPVPAGAPPATPAPDAGALTLSNGLTLPPAARPLKALPGAYAMPFEEYLQHPALGRSTLDKIRKSPRALQHYLQHGEEDTAAFLQGRVLHRLILEPKEFWVKTAVWKGGRRAGKAWDAFVLEHPGKDLITEAEEAFFREAEETWRSHALTGDLLARAELEAVAFFSQGGVSCKARADIVKGDTVYDLKTTSDLANFEKNAWTFGYHRQAAWYLDAFTAATGRTFKAFKFVVIEKSSPADFAVFDCAPELLAIGRQENEQNLALYKHCLETGTWPGWAPVAECRLELPPWIGR